MLLRQEAAFCPTCTLGSGRESELPRGEVSITTERGCLPGALGGYHWLEAGNSQGCLCPGARVKKTGEAMSLLPFLEGHCIQMFGSCHLCKKDSESRKGRVISKGD